MAAKKKAKTAKAGAGRKTSRTVKKAKATRGTARKTAASRKKAPARKAAAKKKVPVRKRKQIVGEGDYEASRTFLKDQAGFVKKNKAKIPAMGKAAERALEGPEGKALRAAEAKAKARSRVAPGEESAPEPGAFVIPPG